jgi:hypothetical protein
MAARRLGAADAIFVFRLVHRDISRKRIGLVRQLLVKRAATDGRSYTQGLRIYAFLASFSVIFSPA